MEATTTLMQSYFSAGAWYGLGFGLGLSVFWSVGMLAWIIRYRLNI